MGIKLSGEQLAELALAKNAGDRIAYYTLLADFGDIYGKLALAVVNNDRGGGATANYFITTQADIEGNPLNSNDLAAIRLQLMNADFAARENAGGAELGYAEIQSYHQQVFASAGLSASAWTANFPLEYLSTAEEKQALWNTLISSGSPGSAAAIAFALADGLATQDPNVIAYLGKLAGAGALGLASSSNEFGDYSVSISSGGLAIGGNEGDDTKNGTHYADVVMGFDGQDTLTGGGDADRLYGGAGDDVLVGATISEGFDPATITFASLETSSHSEWNDGEKDILVGGEGNDVYLVGGGVNTPNVQLTDQQLEDRAKLDLIDGSDADFTAYSQWVSDGMTITVKLTSADLAAATSFGDLLSFDTALASVYYPDYDEKYGFSLLGQKVYDAVAKEAILYVDAMVNSYTNALLFGIKNYLTFDPTSNGGWRIEGNNGDNGDLAGTDGDDTVFARGGNDSIDASTHGGGYDRYDGGDGVDTISYATSTENLTISHDDFWGEYSATGSSGESDTFTNIERIIGGLGNDSIAGSDADETFAGGGGNDTINGGGGVNTVDFSMHTASVTVQFTSTGQGTAVGTQNGQDSFAAIQNVIGSQGNDTITGDSADNIIDGQNGSDQIDGGAGFDTVAFLNSIASYTIIVASGGHLQIWDHTYTDTVINVEEFSFAGVAFTYAAVQAAAASMTLGTSGGDSLTGSTGGDAIFGGAGSDTIFGLAGNDLIYGEDGDDVIFAGDGTNNINGGNGSDTVIINGAQSDFTVTVQRDHSVLVTASGITNRIADVEWIAFDAPDGQDDTSINVGFLIESNSSTDLTGSGGNETLTGTAGHDTIHGLAGNDTIYGLQGDDTIDAGAGDDVVFAGTGKDIVDGGDGVDTVVIGGAYTDFAISVRDDHSILISGNGVSNTISHAEWIVFDTPDSQNDTSVSVSGLIEAQSATAVAGTISADTLTGTAGQDTITGLGGNDTIYGLAGDDVINAGDGDDVIFAGVGANLVDGGNGSDTLVIDGAYDDFKLDLVNNSTVVVSGGQLMDVANNVEWIVFDAPGTGTDHSIDVSQFILQNSTHTLEGTSGADTLNGGAGLDTIHGQDGDDTIYGLGNKDALYGQAGNDILFGGDGDDIIVGGDGDDFLVGGGGTDTFAFDPSNGQDWIDDFDVGVDKIDVSAIASLHDFSAVLANAQEWVSGTTWLYADVNNYVRLEGVSIASLQANDFVFA